jgi:hypothetical protein
MLAAIGEEWGLIVEFTCRYYADYVQVVARAWSQGGKEVPQCMAQALSKSKYGKVVDRAQIEFTLAFDLWCQLDGGGATAAKRGVPRDWRGRPEIPRRRNAQ